MPRDVDPSVREVPGVTLLDIDDLRAFAQAGVDERRREIAAVRDLVEIEVQRWIDDATAREVAPIVAALHSRAERLRAYEVERFKARFEGLDERQRDAVDALTRGIVAKLLHDPIVRLKELSAPGTEHAHETLLAQLYDLELPEP
jgi:glutamyl-tRNA reductase